MSSIQSSSRSPFTGRSSHLVRQGSVLSHRSLKFLATAEFQAWAQKTHYTLETVPTETALHTGPSAVRYKITYRDPHTQDTVTKDRTIGLTRFLRELRECTLDGTSISEILVLHLQMPDKKIAEYLSIKSTRIFSCIKCFVYVGDPQHLEQHLGVSWSASFPQMEQLKLQGKTTVFTFRKVLTGCPKLKTFIVNSLVQDDLREGSSPPPPAIIHSNLEKLKVVSDVCVERAFYGVTAGALNELHLWMMPEVAMGFQREHLGIKTARRLPVKLNFEVGDDVNNCARQEYLITKM